MFSNLSALIYRLCFLEENLSHVCDTRCLLKHGADRLRENYGSDTLRKGENIFRNEFKHSAESFPAIHPPPSFRGSPKFYTLTFNFTSLISPIDYLASLFIFRLK